MKKKTKTISKFKIFYLFIFILISGLIIFYYLNSSFKNIFQIRKEQKLLEEVLKEQERNYQEDIYGGKTPEETYNLFLEALKKEDINLAIKYFLFEKQEEYKKLLEKIKNNGQWEIMLKDLENSKNQQGIYLTEDWYKMTITNDNKEVVTVITFQRPKNTQFQNLTPLWKIAEF